MNQDSCMAITKNAWSPWHFILGMAQVTSNKLNPAKQILPDEKASWAINLILLMQSDRSILSTDRILTGTTALVCSESGSGGNEMVIYTPHNWNFTTGCSLVSYLGHSFCCWEVSPPPGMQLVYSRWYK